MNLDFDAPQLSRIQKDLGRIFDEVDTPLSNPARQWFIANYIKLTMKPGNSEANKSSYECNASLWSSCVDVAKWLSYKEATKTSFLVDLNFDILTFDRALSAASKWKEGHSNESTLFDGQLIAAVTLPPGVPVYYVQKSRRLTNDNDDGEGMIGNYFILPLGDEKNPIVFHLDSFYDTNSENTFFRLNGGELNEIEQEAVHDASLYLIPKYLIGTSFSEDVILKDGWHNGVNDSIIHVIKGVIDNGEETPAVIKQDGTQEWFSEGLRHRLNGPAVIEEDGTQKYYKNGELHRDDGPAIITALGEEVWYKNGQHVEKENEYDPLKTSNNMS